jgi:short subunit dehydrogenase-like uncharacterized protein
MGRRITALWALQGASATLRLAVRRKEAMENFGAGASVVIARLEEPATLRDALADVAVVINAMGPYAYDPAPLLDASAAAGTHYIDLASEPEFLAAVQSWGERHQARTATPTATAP